MATDYKSFPLIHVDSTIINLLVCYNIRARRRRRYPPITFSGHNKKSLKLKGYNSH
ncbi:hypothetical protein ACJIZ3_020742 [Penstemon smallii]|uniref:Transposase n=1 Tax=Penstemon smallii TaxID=265156 RepID=A0ABD3SKB9_9LAMI